MLWKEILSILDSSTIVILQESDPASNFYSIELMSVHEKNLSSDILYFSTFSELHQVLLKAESDLQKTSTLSIILYCDQPIPKTLPTQFKNFAVVYSMDPFFDSFNLSLRAFRQSFQMNNALQQLTELVASESDLNIICEWISQFYHHPVRIDDNSFSIIGHSDLQGFSIFDAPDLIDDFTIGHVPPNIIRQVQAEQDQTYFRGHSSKPSLIHHTRGKFKHYSTPVLVGATTAGFFSVFLQPNEDLSPLEIIYLEKIAKLISIVIQRTDFYLNNKAHFYTHFFASMLSGKPDYTQDWENRITTYGYTLKPIMRMVAVRFPDTIQKRSELTNLASALHQLFPGSIYFIQNDLILLFCSTDAGEFSASYVNNLGDDFFVRNSLKIGISSEFYSLYDMKTHYNDAKSAIDLGMIFAPKEHFYLYDNLRLYDVVCHLAADNDIMSFCYPPFMTLFQYDIDHGTQLGPTLYLYISDPKQPAAVCEKLNIHKNTLYFRLDKARSIMNVDYNQLSVATQIYFTVIILRYTKQIQADIYDFSKPHHIHTLEEKTD